MWYTYVGFENKFLSIKLSKGFILSVHVNAYNSTTLNKGLSRIGYTKFAVMLIATDYSSLVYIE